MSVTALIAELGELGIELGQQDCRIWYRPRSSMTPDLVERMKAHQGALLAMLRPNPPAEETADRLLDDLAHRGCILGLDGDGRLVMDGVPPDLANDVARHEAELIRILKIETASMAEAMVKIIDPPDPCPKCEFMELWQTLAGNWRCLRCDPPAQARRLRERADRLRGSPRRNSNGD